MSLLERSKILLARYGQLIVDAFDKTYYPEGVDLFNETLNGNPEEFESDEGIRYRKHPLTRISSFLGWPNRKLHKNSGQSWQNLWDNFLGKQDSAGKKRLLRRAIVMVPLNIIFTLLRLPVNIAKLVFEVAPLSISNILKDVGDDLIRKMLNVNQPGMLALTKSLLYFAAAYIVYGIRWLFESIYLTDCCLFSPFDSIRAAWHYGNSTRFGKLAAYFLCGLSIFTTIIMYSFALPLAAKILATNVGPFIAHHLPVAIDHAIDKIAQLVSPTLSAIGHVYTQVIDTFMSFSNIALYYILPALSSVPALVGGSLFVATAIAIIGPVINSYIDDFRAWWNYDPSFTKQEQGEGASTAVLAQQSNMLCALGNKNLPAAMPVVAASSLSPAPPTLSVVAHDRQEAAQMPAPASQPAAQRSSDNVVTQTTSTSDQLSSAASTPAEKATTENDLEEKENNRTCRK